MRRHVTTYGLTVGGFVVMLGAIVALNGLGSFSTDIKPEVYLAPWRMVGQYLSAWTDTPYLGSANFNVGLVPVLLVTSALRGIGLSPQWAFKLLHFALWLLAAWGASRLLRRISPSAGRWAGLAAGVLYLANPYSIQAGSTLAITLPYAVLPWMLIAFVRALRGPGGWAWRSWVWPGLFGLAFFAMSGMNVAIVPVLQLLALIPVMIFARTDWDLGWGHIGGVLARCALLVLGVSAYWLVPSVAAIGHGIQIADTSETITGIAKVSSFPEVLRGLGMWPLYGHGAQGPWVPQDTVFLTSPLVMMLTICWPALGLVAMRWCRGFLRGTVAVMVAFAAVVMVGAFPGEHHPASPFGWALVRFLQLPGMAAFRTTNKAGAVLALGLALAIGYAALQVGPALMRRDGVGPVVVAVCFGMLFAWTLPALTNRLYTSQMNIPGYWKSAAGWLNDRSAAGGVLFLPGQTRPSYRWTEQRPDDVANSLLTRQTVIPETTPNASAPGANFLMAMDRTLQDGVLPASTVSDYARYLGISQVLLRRDTAWEQDGGARPSQTTATLDADPGLKRAAQFGAPGEFTTGPGDDAGPDARLTPLQVYDVRHPRPLVRAEPLSNSIVVAGDGWSIPELAGAGLLKSTPTFQYAQDVTAARLRSLLGGGHRLVITDTNARRSAIPARLTSGEGALLTAHQRAPLMRTLGSDPADQTVLVRSGARVSATMQGATFFKLPYGVAANALDGDPATSWLFGDFHRAAGQVLTIREPRPVTLHRIRISQTDLGSAKIDRVTVAAGGRRVTRRLPDTGYATFDLHGVRASTVTVTVDSQRGRGYNLVGINDIRMPGPLAQRAARTPTTFSRRYAQLTPDGRRRFDRTPLDVLLRRVQNTASTNDDTQTGLHRIVTLPDRRTFTAAASVRLDPPLMEQADDRLAGLTPRVLATSSDFWFHQPGDRASLAADGDPGTGWVPGGDLKGAWWQLRGPRRAMSKVTIDQQAGPGDPTGARTRWATRVTVTVDGVPVRSAAVSPHGSTTITFPRRTGRTLRVTVDRATGPAGGVPARFVRIGTGLTVRHAPAGDRDARCLTVATVDGRAVRMRPVGRTLAGQDQQGTRWTGCGRLTLSAGAHRITQAPGVTLDSLDLLDVQHPRATHPAAPRVTVTHDGPAGKSMTVDTAGPAAVLISQSYDPRWQATANGTDLGAPRVIDGYSIGWILPKGGHYTLQLRYGPQTVADVAIGVSLAVLLAALVLLALGTWTGALRVIEPAPDEADQPRRRLVPRLRRPGTEAVLVLLATVAAGWAGLAAGLLVVAVLRWRRVPADWLQTAGAVLLLVSLGVYLAGLGDQRGQVSADAVGATLWPHYLAGAGLVIGLAGVLLGHRRRRHPPSDRER